MIRKILKWTGLTLLSIILLLAVVIASRQHLEFEAPYPAIKASTDTAVIARGKELAYGASICAQCHGPEKFDSLLKAGQQIALTGGREFKIPLGVLRVRNITPDKETGIGNRTDGEIARVIRYSVLPDGRATWMPHFDMNDNDLTAVVSFLRSQQPVKHKVPDHEMNLMGKAIVALLIKPSADAKRKIPEPVKRDSTVEYGKYLAHGVSNCVECHSKPGRQFGGGDPMGLEGEIPYAPPNISTDRSSRIYGWSQQNFIDRFRLGRVIPNTHMPWEALGRMTDNDLKAIYKYLQTVPPVKPDSVIKK
jgi:mono/diheme cytochrome c family protein